jgi:hypothetical protein
MNDEHDIDQNDRPEPQPLTDERDLPFGAVDPRDVPQYAQATFHRTSVDEDVEPPVFMQPAGSLTAEYLAILAEKLAERFDQIESKIDRILEIVGTQHGTVPAADDEGELIN